MHKVQCYIEEELQLGTILSCRQASQKNKVLCATNNFQSLLIKPMNVPLQNVLGLTFSALSTL